MKERKPYSKTSIGCWFFRYAGKETRLTRHRGPARRRFDCHFWSLLGLIHQWAS